ncbi:MAG: DUF4340 domain-containing protein [Brevinemataceae bacterium]
MKKETSIFISLSLLLIGLGILIITEKRKIRIKPHVQNISWSTMRKDQLTGIETILYQDSKEFRYSLERKNAEWYLTYPIQTEASASKSAILANDFLNLNIQSTISNVSTEEFESYGLSNPILKVSGIFKKNLTNSFIVGKKTSVGNQYYIAENNITNTVYIIEQTNLEPFLQGITSIINNYFITRSTDEILELSIRNFKGQELSFAYINGFWIQTAPQENTQIDWIFRRFLLRVKDLQFKPETIIFNTNKSTLEKIGISTNSSPKISVTFQNGSFSEFYIGKERQDNTYPVFIPSQSLIALSEDDIINEIFLISEDTFVKK